MIGFRVWVIPEGYIPTGSFSEARELVSHDAACILNCSDNDARVEIMLYFEDREPVGPYRVEAPARRTRHMRFNDLSDPAPVPRDMPYSSLFTSTEPVVIQHTRLDSRDPHIALMTTIAHPVA